MFNDKNDALFECEADKLQIFKGINYLERTR